MAVIGIGQPSVNIYSFKSFIAVDLVIRKFIGLNDLKSWENTSIGPQWTQVLMTLKFVQNVHHSLFPRTGDTREKTRHPQTSGSSHQRQRVVAETLV